MLCLLQRAGEPMNQQLRFWDPDPTLHNVFFAALPDAAMAGGAKRISSEVRRRLGLTAMPIPAERLHVSLVPVGGFSGSRPSAVIDAARMAANAVSMAPFRVEFDRVTSFSGGHGKRALVLTGSGDGVAGLVTLQKALSQAMTKAGLSVRPRPSFSPHLTMMYAARDCDFVIEPIGWTVSRFVLIDSLVGQSRHVHLGQWPL